MKTNHKKFARAIRDKNAHTPIQRVRQQLQVRATAAQSAALSAPVKQALDEWSQRIDQMAVLVNQVEVARQSLKKLSGELRTVSAEGTIAERGYLSAVDLVSQGNVDVIHSLGCHSSGAARAAAGPLEPPTALVAKPGTDPGAAHLSWVKAPGAVAYMLQVSSDPPTEVSWRSVPGTTRIREAVGGLVSGARTWFRVASLGTSGQSRYSEPVVTNAR